MPTSNEGVSRAVSAASKTEEEALEASLRPQTLEDFIGQDKLKKNLRVFIQAAPAPR